MIKRTNIILLLSTLIFSLNSWASQFSNGFCAPLDEPLTIENAILEIKGRSIEGVGVVHEGPNHDFFRPIDSQEIRPYGVEIQELNAVDWGGEFTLQKRIRTLFSYASPTEDINQVSYTLSSKLHLLKFDLQEVECTSSDQPAITF